ncbi:unnamed protein product [Closterium sp. NIES-54]
MLSLLPSPPLSPIAPGAASCHAAPALPPPRILHITCSSVPVPCPTSPPSPPLPSPFPSPFSTAPGAVYCRPTPALPPPPLALLPACPPDQTPWPAGGERVKGEEDTGGL